MNRIAIIGGTDLCELKNLKAARREQRTTPYGLSSAPLTYGILHGKEVIFIARHSDTYSIPPHKINYRANIWALREAGVSQVIGVSIVGGIRSDMTPGQFVIPDQLIDYTYAREHTFFDGQDKAIHHINFGNPFSIELRQVLLNAADEMGLEASDNSVYGVLEGPRMPTTAEVNRLERDGCDVIGMSLMPEAALARELAMNYACLSIVAGRASGRDNSVITLERMTAVYKESTEKLHGVLQKVIEEI